MLEPGKNGGYAGNTCENVHLQGTSGRLFTVLNTPVSRLYWMHREEWKEARTTLKVTRQGQRSSVAVDDADDDDDCHAREGTDAQYQPTVGELPRDHVTEEDGSGVYWVLGVLCLGGRALASAGAPGGRVTRAIIDGQVWGASNRLGSAVVQPRLARQIHAAQSHT